MNPQQDNETREGDKRPIKLLRTPPYDVVDIVEPHPRPAVIIVPVQVLKRFLSVATLEENQAVTKLLSMDGVVHPSAQSDGTESA